MGAIINILYIILIALGSAYVLGVVTLAGAHWLLEVEDMGWERALTWPIVKVSLIFGSLWPYYGYRILTDKY